jgi:DNA-directed RNA polymerase specialized sigma24 family protein
MTPADEATFIALWAAGLTCPEIAQRLDIPPGTARSRAYHLSNGG